MVYRNKKALIAALGITPTTRILDVGFVGQAVTNEDAQWPHQLLREKTPYVYGVDLEFDTNLYPQPTYIKASAESFSFPEKFDLIFAGDLIEHLSNPGLFLESCKRALVPGGRIVITTPNAFNFFAIVEKITHEEPNVNKDHTLYFNKRVLSVLFKKNGLTSYTFDHIYTLGTLWEGGLKRRILASVYAFISFFTPKFSETMVAIVTVP